MGRLMLFGATLIWGTSFLILKETLSSLPVMFVLAIRFIFSSLLILIVYHKKFKNLTKRTVLLGLLLGVVLTAAYILQTYGLTGTSPGENAFLTSTYSVMVPFMCWIFLKKKPSVYSIVAAFICIVGIGFINIKEGGFSFGYGGILTLLSAVFYGLQILVLNYVGDKEDAWVMLFFQLFTVGVCCAIGSGIFEIGRAEIVFDLNSVLSLVYLTFVVTLVAQAFQIFGQKKVPASRSAIILSMESVFGFLFSLFLGGESLTVFSVVGFVLIFISVIISETKLEFITRIFKEKK